MKKLDAAGTFVLVNHLVHVFCSPRVSQVPLWATTLPRQPQSHRRLDVWPSQTVVSVWTRAWKSDTGALRVTFLFKVTNFGDETQLNELRFHTVTHTHTSEEPFLPCSCTKSRWYSREPEMIYSLELHASLMPPAPIFDQGKGPCTHLPPILSIPVHETEYWHFTYGGAGWLGNGAG